MTFPFLKLSQPGWGGLKLSTPVWFVSWEFRHESDFLVFPKRGAAIFGNKVNIVRAPAVLDPNLMGWKAEDDNVLEYFGQVLRLIRLKLGCLNVP